MKPHIGAAALAVLAAMLVVAPASAGGSHAAIQRAMTSIRESGSRPVLPYLVVGVRDSEGYRGYVSSDVGEGSASGAVSVASSTKSFTAVLVLQLDQEGKLSIDDTLADPRWRDVIRWPGGERITLRMLLAHTSGIPDYEDSEAFAARKLDPDWDPSPEEVIAFARPLPPLFEPGTGWAYSNTGYQILGLVIEAVTGNSYADELERRFFEPLGLRHTYLYGHQPGSEPQPSYFLWCKGVPLPRPSSPPAEKLEREDACLGKRPPAYHPLADYYANDEHKLAWSDGGIVSTAEDMTLWMTKLIASDEVLDEAHRALMQQATPQSVAAIANDTNLPAAARSYWKGYGLGLQIYQYDAGPGFGHGGNIEGFSSNAVYLPGHGNDFAIEVIAPLLRADSAFDSSNRIAAAVAGQNAPDAADVGPEEGPILTPVTQSVLSPPRWYPGDDGRIHLQYELMLTNTLPLPINVTTVEVSDASGRRIEALSGERLAAAMTLLGSETGATTRLPASTVAIVWLDLSVPTRRQLPVQLEHRLTVDVGPGLPIGPSITYTGGRALVAREAALALAPPLRGGPWVAIAGPSGPHRRALQAVDGSLHNGQRFAVDVSARLDAEGRTHVGDAGENASYLDYGQPVLAVGPGTVVEAVDGLPDQTPNHNSPIPLAEADGNHVILRLARGVFVGYGHLQPGSVRVEAGERVRTGQILGRLGNSGQSTGPHLHLQVMSRPSFLAADGLPFVLRRFDLEGRTTSLETFLDADLAGSPVPIDATGAGTRRNQGLTGLEVLRFPDHPSSSGEER